MCGASLEAQELPYKMGKLDPDNDVLQHAFLAQGLPQSSAANTCMRTDTGEETPEVSKQSSFNREERSLQGGESNHRC